VFSRWRGSRLVQVKAFNRKGRDGRAKVEKKCNGLKAWLDAVYGARFWW